MPVQVRRSIVKDDSCVEIVSRRRVKVRGKERGKGLSRRSQQTERFRVLKKVAQCCLSQVALLWRRSIKVKFHSAVDNLLFSSSAIFCLNTSGFHCKGVQPSLRIEMFLKCRRKRQASRLQPVYHVWQQPLGNAYGLWAFLCSLTLLSFFHFHANTY